MPRPNRYPATCTSCGTRVGTKAGFLLGNGNGAYTVQHIACHEATEPRVVEFALNGGDTLTRNVNGTCEDAPCCGCCTF